MRGKYIMKFTLYSDPGHGWLKVSKKLLTELNIADKISSYSYQRGDFAFLEEDCDLAVFFEAMSVKGETIEYKYQIGNKTSRIRNYDSYKYEKI